MKQISKTIKYSLMLLIVSIALFQNGCKKDSNGGGAPVITKIRAYKASPADSVLSVIIPGNWIVIQGSNLASTKSILFDGFQVQLSDLHNAIFSDNSIVVPVPSNIPFGTVTDAQLNTITVTNAGGTTTIKFPIAFPKMTISSVSNEFALPGDSIAIMGAGLFKISKVVFPGNLEVTKFSTIPTGQYITVQVPPSLTKSGPIQVISDFGTATSSFNIEDTTGMKCNFDNVNNQNAWDNVVSNDPTAFPGGRGNYGVFQFADCPVGDWGDWQSGRGIRTTQIQWVPVANLSDSTSKWAVKFEMYVKNPWSAGCIFVHDWSWGRTCRFEPWKVITPYITPGWITFTLPLSSFRTKTNGADGTGDPAVTVGDLLVNDNNGNNGDKYLVFLFNNPLVEVTNFYAAIDNIRIVKIR